MSMLSDNIRFLQGQDPELAARILESEGGVLTLMTARNGLPTASIAGRCLHSTYDPSREAQAWADQMVKVHQPNEDLLVEGIGLLYHLEALCHVVSPEIHLMMVVPDLRELFDALTVRSLAGWGKRVKWIWGSPEEMASKIALSSCPTRIVTYTPASLHHDEQYNLLHVALRERLSRQQGGTLRIAVIGPVYGGSLPVAQYVVSALKSLGHRVNWIDHSVHHPGYQALETLRDHHLRLAMQSRFGETLGVISLAHIAEEPPDLVLALSQAPLSVPILEQMRRKKVLTAIWFVENYRHLTYWQQLAAGYDFWFVMQKDPFEGALKRAGARQVQYLPLAADPLVHRPISLTPAEQEEVGADVSFLGAGYPNRRMLLPSLLNQEWSFKLWGNEWENPGPLESVLQRGGARINTELSVKIFNATRVNLNLHSFSGPGFDPDGDCVNPRTFELAACGSFQVVDHRTLLPDLFDPSMMGVIPHPDQLVPQVRRYLQEPETRTEMGYKAREHVLRHHTYVHRMEALLGEVGVQSPDRIGAVLRGDRQAHGLIAKARASCPELVPMLKSFPPTERVELEDVAAAIRAKGPTAILNREELLVLMMDEYRQEKKDFV